MVYRVTKYDPARRSTEGVFLGNDWTSVADIGRTFDTGVLTYAGYRKGEDGYVESVRRFVAAAGVPSLEVRDLEWPRESYTRSVREMDDLSPAQVVVREGFRYSGRDLEAIVRLVLREGAWCRLVAEDLLVHFSWDYYMHIAIAKDIEPPELPEGMYLEIDAGFFDDEDDDEGE